MSGRIRSIKPEINKDADVASLSSPAWRLWISMWTVADDDGRLPASIPFLHGEVFWASEPELPIEDILAELLVGNFIRLYRARGNWYARIRNFADKHQRIDRATPAKYPGPNDADTEAEVIERPDGSSYVEMRPSERRVVKVSHTSKTPSDSRVPRRSTLQAFESAIVGGEGRGEEGKGEEKSRPVLDSADPGPDTQEAPAPMQQALLAVVELPDADPVRLIFDHWLAGWRSRIRGKRTPELSEKRERAIRSRLKTYSADDIRRAIDAMWASEFHVSEGHYDIELVCRNEEKLDAFLAKADRPSSKLRTVLPPDRNTSPGNEEPQATREEIQKALAICDANMASRILGES